MKFIIKFIGSRLKWSILLAMLAIFSIISPQLTCALLDDHFRTAKGYWQEFEEDYYHRNMKGY